MKEIKLTQGKIALVDDEDFEYLSQFKWFANKDKNTFYAMRCITINGQQKPVMMHRLIMNTPKGKETDHKDLNGLNNQRSNLRNCTHSQNHCNVRPKGKSKYIGVSVKPSGFQTEIKSDSKRIYLGIYKIEEDAARAYDNAAKKYHGEYANLNFK